MSSNETSLRSGPEEEQTQSFSFSRMIDLSTGLINDAAHEPAPPQIQWRSHGEHGSPWMERTFGLGDAAEVEISGGLGPATEVVTAVAHAGTHVDAPWHYHPTSEGRPAKTIDECPLEWFLGDGVVLDLRHKEPGEKIRTADLEAACEAIDYEIKPGDIPMIMSGNDRKLGDRSYLEHPGLSREGTEWILDHGVKVLGVDMYGLDLPFADMAAAYAATGSAEGIWEAHFVGIEREFCHIEKLCNLDRIPRPHGFKVAVFPIKIERGSGGWCRAVAFV